MANNAYSFDTDGGDHQFEWFEWHYITFHFHLLCAQNRSTGEGLRPGEYEVKGPRDGKLSRTLTHGRSEGPNRDTGGVLAQNGLTGASYRLHAVAPVTIIGDANGPVDAASVKTEGYYRNPPAWASSCEVKDR